MTRPIRRPPRGPLLYGKQGEPIARQTGGSLGQSLRLGKGGVVVNGVMIAMLVFVGVLALLLSRSAREVRASAYRNHAAPA